MSKKLQANGLWESSRMMLPQHKERIIEHRSKDNVTTRPTLHEDEVEIISLNLRMSLSYTLETDIEIFNEYGNRIIKGIVASVSASGKRIKLETETGYELLNFDDLVSVKIIEGGDPFETDA
ncbi:YolD-like family protein [Paenibacillus barcinonensis]|uniref:YolD-like family protein n=1 Tax=Paenibacillus barcinonensis TaxID=198119 RepID=A0A2V4VW35_PAEBA|nr:YolD-like family protein [Paenibacillus barcinonensis]PYE51516.1 YolD-like protein [Paenibacillus barcinonensis]QKS55899.1 YolD-like family protein [Paenibacillus barcinonensis]